MANALISAGIALDPQMQIAPTVLTTLLEITKKTRVASVTLIGLAKAVNTMKNDHTLMQVGVIPSALEDVLVLHQAIVFDALKVLTLINLEHAYVTHTMAELPVTCQ